MSYLILLLCFCSCLLAKTYDLSQESSLLYQQYLEDYNLNFEAKEREIRYRYFLDNLDIIQGLNAQNPRAEFGLTKFSHLSASEFKNRYLTLKTTERTESDPVDPEYSEEQVSAIPDTYDWRTKGAVTDVKDQGQCGSCWAFSATGNMEGQWFLAGNKLVPLSEQNLVDCDHECLDANDCDAGCEGGLQPNAFNYVIKNGGIDTEDVYPYTAEDGTCTFKAAGVGAKISNWTFVSTDETQIAAYLVAHGPLSVAVDATIWQFYLFGVISAGCGTTLDHGVLIVGYGSETDDFGQNIDYWLIKNSWGASWGYSGYVYIERGTGCCGVNTYVTCSKVK